MVLRLANEEEGCQPGDRHFARGIKTRHRAHVPQLFGKRLVALDETTLATAKQVVTVGIHAFSARLAIQRLVQREQWLAQIQFVQHRVLRWLQAKPEGHGGASIEP